MGYTFRFFGREVSLFAAGICCAIYKLQSGAVWVAEIGARPIDRAAASVFLEKDLDTLRAQPVQRRWVFGSVDHERMMHAIRHFERFFVDGRRALDQQHADTA